MVDVVQPYEDALSQLDVDIRFFRQQFPEFRDSSIWPDESLEIWLQVANASLDTARWRNYYRMGVALFVAHMLALGKMSELQAQRGGVPGMNMGLVSSKSVNGVSISYNNSLAVMEGGGHWNLTSYGLRFLYFARMAGSGPVQITGLDAFGTNDATIMRMVGLNGLLLH